MENCYKTTNSDRYQSLKEKARDMRNKPTETESLLWQYLRNSGVGAKFRRQHPIDDYIADFICLSAKLIVELDGGVHDSPDNKEHDRIRDEVLLNKYGFRIIRFSNKQVNTQLDGVLEEIKKNINI